jgi:hypothetical protein
MSMIGYLRLVSESVVDGLAHFDDEEIAEYLFPDDESSDETLDIDKAWHAVHFLLCGSADPGPSTFASAILGGDPVGPDLGYGPTRYLSAERVREVAAALETIGRSELEKRYDADALNSDCIYPEMWDTEPGVLDFIGGNYENVRELYMRGRENGQAMLLWLA